MTDTIQHALSEIQCKLNAPKNQRNDFGKYNYRKAEDIIAAFKSLQGGDETLTLSDDVVMVGDKLFVKSTATYSKGGESVSCIGWAMHALQKKGMDDAQITGSCSSYARKYALGGLFAIDDSDHDPDGMDNRPKQDSAPQKPNTTAIRNEMLKDGVPAMMDAAAFKVVTSNPKWMSQLETLAQHDEPKHNEVQAAVLKKKQELGIE